MSHRQANSDGTGAFANDPPYTSEPMGAVLLTFDDPVPMEVPALILIREETGFRVRHHCLTLRPGQIVCFEDLHAKGQAQVLSTEFKHGCVETRFWVVAEQA